VKGRPLKTNIDGSNPQTTSQRLSLSSAFFATFLCILFGANTVAVKISLTGLGVFTTAGIRFTIATFIVFLWALYTQTPLAINRVQVRQLALLGLIFFTQLSLFYFGLGKTTASHGTLIANVLPFVVMILAHFFIPGDKINLKKVSGLILGFSGVLVLFFDNITLTSAVFQGDLLVLMAVLVWGCNVVYVKSIIGKLHPIQVTLYPMLMAAPIFLLCGVFLDKPMVIFIDWTIVTAMFYQTFVTGSFGLVAWNTMIRKFGATTLHSFIFIMPISGVYLGVILLDEPLTANLLFSIVLVVTGLIVVNRAGAGVPG
jgi:drug/metabolite transporter (DMT)-like permease